MNPARDPAPDRPDRAGDAGSPVPELLGARRLRELFARHGFVPRRSLGQNFVIDPNTIRKVVDVAGVGPDDRVLEIGPGAGSLTLELARRARGVVALEADRRLIPILTEVVGQRPDIDIVLGDAMQVDYRGLGRHDGVVTRLVANLPYNIAVPVVLRVLEQAAPTLESLTVMTQREVGERLAASAGSRVYGQTSVLVALFGHARVQTHVSRRAFFPVPNVDSVVVRIDRAAEVPVDRRMFTEVVRASFAQRRKTMRNALAPLVGTALAAETALSLASIAPSARAEELDLQAFLALTRAVVEVRG